MIGLSGGAWWTDHIRGGPVGNDHHLPEEMVEDSALWQRRG